MLPRALVAAWQADVSASNRSLWFIIAPVKAADGHHLLGHLQAVNLDQDAGKLPIPRRGENLPSFAKDAEANLRISQCILFEHMKTMAYFAVTALQKLEACRHSTKEVAHRQRRTLWCSRRAHF